jgi:leucyl aminopeptidase
MTDAPKLGFAPFARLRGVLVVFCGENLKFGTATQRALAPIGDLVRRAAAADRFTGKNGTTLDIVAPAELKLPRLVVVGIGKDSELKRKDVVKLGGIAMGKVPAVAAEATIFAEFVSGALKGDQVADLVLGARLRAYTFDRYKTKRKDDDNRPKKVEVNFACGNPAAAEKAWANASGIADGVVIARDLVNEPANVLYPAEFARRASSLAKLGVGVEVLDVAAMKKLGMGALLGVGQGSVHESKVVVMRWNGGKRGAAPVAFIGKGVCFDTGGISIKPASGMEDMKGDMAGAACVVGLMHALAARKAKVNAVGAIGLVENMVDGKSFRPGDILKSYSGKTIEITNTDAEGRLVLCDVISYTIKRFKPDRIIDLATLTGGIITALGHRYAGLFSNDKDLADNLVKAGKSSGEVVWPFPMDEEYLRPLDSRFADIKNAAGRAGQPITSAKFIEQFVGDTCWAHIDMAGPAFGATVSEIDTSWGHGWGVRLLSELVDLVSNSRNRKNKRSAT